MTRKPTFDDIFAVMSAASVGDAEARVALPPEPQVDDLATRFAVALNVLLDDLALRTEELGRTEEQLLQVQKMEAIGRLAGGVAHDFNNILSVILSSSELLLQDLKPDDPLRADLLEIKTAGERASKLTRQLLAFSRQQILEPRVVNLNDVVTSLDKMMQRLVREDVTIVTRPAPRLGMVKVDPGHIEQVIVNLVVNASDAMPAGGRLTIETANMDLDEGYARQHVGVAPGPHVMVAISDTGVGMDKATLERIFEPFFTTKEKGQGTGLGLATVFGIVKQNRGNIWAYSELGKGSTFKVYLPRSDEPQVDERVAEPSTSTLRGDETILLVEDDDQLRLVAREILERNGYRVLEAHGGGEALLLCEQRREAIDLLLTDVVMPQIGGKELAERLRPLHPEMKVLYMSGYTGNAIVHHGVLEEGIVLLEKPITPEKLLRRVRQVLDSAPTEL